MIVSDDSEVVGELGVETGLSDNRQGTGNGV